MINKILLFILSIIFLSGCQNVRDALTMKKEQNVDEFLIEKKNPLVVPPEFSKLPIPRNEVKEEIKEDKKIDLSQVLEKNDETKISNSSSELEKSISNILNKK